MRWYGAVTDGSFEFFCLSVQMFHSYVSLPSLSASQPRSAKAGFLSRRAVLYERVFPVSRGDVYVLVFHGFILNSLAGNRFPGQSP